MAEEELEALRKHRLAELQAKHGVSAPTPPPGPSPEGRRLHPRWKARPQAEAPGADAPALPAAEDPASAAGGLLVASEQARPLSPVRGVSGGQRTMCCPGRVGRGPRLGRGWFSSGQALVPNRILSPSGLSVPLARGSSLLRLAFLPNVFSNLIVPT